MTRTRGVIALLLLALTVYTVLIGVRGVFLLTQSRWSLKALGVAVLVLPLVGLWAVAAEIRFGRSAQRLTDELLADRPGPAHLSPLARRPSGRVDRAAADALFATQREQVQADPDDWRRWYRLAEAYDLAGDRRRARAALREAIERHPKSE